MRKIAVLTGSRGEWGYIRPILRLIEQDPDLDYQIIATNMHVLPEFGMSVHEIERDGFRIAERLYMTFDGYNGVTMAKSLGALMMELPTVLGRLRPDLLLLAGDRGEQLVGALTAVHLGIPSAHIQAGELSGNVDGIVRHAITKLAHVHFAANEEFAERVRRLGEEEFRIHLTGAPLVDELVAGVVTPEPELRSKYGLDPDRPFLLAVQHPVTEEEEAAETQATELIAALLDVDWPTVFIFPNADAGSEAIRRQLTKLRRPHFRLFRNLPRQDYLGLMKLATVMVGNSSSGIMEAPSFGTATVNIGRRQIGRPQAENVINTEFSAPEIVAAIRQAASPEFQERARRARNPYGDGNASKRIVEILKTLVIDDVLLLKKMAY